MGKSTCFLLLLFVFSFCQRAQGAGITESVDPPHETYNLTALVLAVKKAELLVPVPVPVAAPTTGGGRTAERKLAASNVKMVKVRVAAKGQGQGHEEQKQQEQLFISLFDPAFALPATPESAAQAGKQTKSDNPAFVQGQGAGKAGVEVAYAIAVAEVEDKGSGGAGMGEKGVDTILPQYGQVNCKPRTEQILSNAGSRLEALRLLGDGDGDGIVGEEGEGARTRTSAPE